MSLCPGCFKEKGATHQCEHCEYDESLKRSAIVLPHLTHLNHDHYIVGRLLGKPGGFGLTYLGWDLRLNKRVAIKEYLPRTLSSRDPDRCTVNSHSHDDAKSFEYGLKRFLEEARTLAQIDHPNVVRVRDYFEENGTAYLVMDYYEGVTLAEYLDRSKSHILPWKQALDVIMPILDGLRDVHEKGFLHRDIKPHNIYLTSKNKPILLDFGAARQAMGEKSSSMSVVLSEGYAPLEQYQRNGKHGPWTDVYGAAATLYTILTGLVYPSPLDRINDPDWELEQPRCPDDYWLLSDAIESGLKLNASERTQTISDFQDKLLLSSRGNPKEAIPTVAAQKIKKTATTPMPSKKDSVEATVSDLLNKVLRFFNHLSIDSFYGNTILYFSLTIIGHALGAIKPYAEMSSHLSADNIILILWWFMLYFAPLANTVIRAKEISLLSFVTCVVASVILPIYKITRSSSVAFELNSALSIAIGLMTAYALYMTYYYLENHKDE